MKFTSRVLASHGRTWVTAQAVLRFKLARGLFKNSLKLF